MSMVGRLVDVVIVGGGVSGLYTAWRLSETTHNRIYVLEYTSRFGGRFLTCKMPGGFPADLGAMRYMQTVHPIFEKLRIQLGLEVEPLFDFPVESVKDPVENQDPVSDGGSQELPHRLVLPEDGNFYAATISGTDQKAKDMSARQLHALNNTTDRPDNMDDFSYPMDISVADFEAYENLLRIETASRGNAAHPSRNYMCVRGGMGRLVDCLVGKLQSRPNVSLVSDCPVTEVDETARGFLVRSGLGELTADRLVLACNARGIELISWRSPRPRWEGLRGLLSQVTRVQGFKLFLTFREAWWERHGLVAGSVGTRLPIAMVTAFGSRGKTDEYATLLASFSYVNQDIFEGLNLPDAARFSNEVDCVPRDLVPSKRLVEFVLKNLAGVFDIDAAEIPAPICAITKSWNSDPIDGGNFHARLGVDTNELQWRALKPFADSEMYVTGDTFPAVSRGGAYIGWSEGVLLNSERILVNHFGLEPYVEGLCLRNAWMTSKL